VDVDPVEQLALFKVHTHRVRVDEIVNRSFCRADVLGVLEKLAQPKYVRAVRRVKGVLEALSHRHTLENLFVSNVMEDYKTDSDRRLHANVRNNLLNQLIRAKRGLPVNLYRGVSRMRNSNDSISSWSSNPGIALGFSRRITNTGIKSGVVMKLPKGTNVAYLQYPEGNYEAEYILAPMKYKFGNQKRLPNGTVITNVSLK